MPIKSPPPLIYKIPSVSNHAKRVIINYYCDSLK